jgi:hypothetical protein
VSTFDVADQGRWLYPDFFCGYPTTPSTVFDSSRSAHPARTTQIQTNATKQTQALSSSLPASYCHTLRADRMYAARTSPSVLMFTRGRHISMDFKHSHDEAVLRGSKLTQSCNFRRV